MENIKEFLAVNSGDGYGAGTGTWHDGMYFDGTYYYDDYGNIYDIYGNLVANPYYYDDDFDYENAVG